MMSEEAFRQVDEKHVSNEICNMVWSPRIDLVALANIQGEVILHRLSWQKVWTLAPPGEGETVGGLAWRPDGKVLAVGYKSGQLKLCDVENADILHTMTVEGEVTSMTWISQVLPDGKEWSSEPYPDDSSADFLPKLQPLNKSYGSMTKGQQEENVEDGKKLKDQKELNLLLVGTDRDELQMFVYGIFNAAVVSISLQDGSQKRCVHSAMLSQDLHCLSVVVESTLSEMSDDIDYYLLTFDTTLFASRHKELSLLALKYGQVATLINYLQTTIQQMSEAWEDILMAMDSKLLKFAEDKEKAKSGHSSSVSNDFLELLLFGTPSEELEQFLQHELTEKGLKKLGHSIETSYSNIQKLVVKHLQSVSQAMVYHLSELRGMSLWYDKFGVLGLDTDNLQKAVHLAGTFVLHTSQLQQVIDGSIKNFKAFFRWLYVVILRLSNEQPPAELSKMTQHEVNFVAEFLRDNFTQFSAEEKNLFSDADHKKSGFKLEKVGQYLKKENLPCPPDTSENPWQQYLNASTFHKDSPVLYTVDNTHSLVQLQEQLVDWLTSTVFHRPAVVIGQSLHCVCTNHLFTLTRPEDSIPRKPVFCQFTDVDKGRCYTVFTADYLPCDKFLVLRQPTDPNRTDSEGEILCISVGTLSSTISQNTSGTSDMERCSHHSVLDIAYYDPQSLSLLLQEDGEDGRPVLLQLSMSTINIGKFTKLATTENIASINNINELDIGSLVNEHSYRHLENMKAHSFAVSGTRKTATVLFSSKRRVRIFLMDAEEEEEEEEDEDVTHGEEELDRSHADGSQSEHKAENSQMMEDGDEDKENTSSIYSEEN